MMMSSWTLTFCILETIHFKTIVPKETLISTELWFNPKTKNSSER